MENSRVEISMSVEDLFRVRIMFGIWFKDFIHAKKHWEKDVSSALSLEPFDYG